LFGKIVNQSFVTAFITLFLIVDPIGSIPAFNVALKNVPRERIRLVIIRECFFGFVLLALFAFGGSAFMSVLGLSQTAMTLGGALVLLIIALRMLFPGRAGVYGEMEEGEPFIFPIAIPMLAGPSALATVMLLVNGQPAGIVMWVGAIALTMALCAPIIISGEAIQRRLGKKVTAAFERLMGLILAVMAVQMFLTGITEFVMALRA
jgi:MarC family membrane protein